MPWSCSEAEVCDTPFVPKSCEWLFALFSTSNPSPAKTPPYHGGFLKSKQLGEGEEPHFEWVEVVRVPSRFPNTICALSSEPLTGSR
jgi:hypothetical protein